MSTKSKKSLDVTFVRLPDRDHNPRPSWVATTAMGRWEIRIDDVGYVCVQSLDRYAKRRACGKSEYDQSEQDDVLTVRGIPCKGWAILRTQASVDEQRARDPKNDNGFWKREDVEPTAYVKRHWQGDSWKRADTFFEDATPAQSKTLLAEAERVVALFVSMHPTEIDRARLLSLSDVVEQRRETVEECEKALAEARRAHEQAVGAWTKERNRQQIGIKS